MTDEGMLLTPEEQQKAVNEAFNSVKGRHSSMHDIGQLVTEYQLKAQLAKAIPLHEKCLTLAGWEPPHEVAARVAKIIQANNDEWTKLREQARQDERKAKLTLRQVIEMLGQLSEEFTIDAEFGFVVRGKLTELRELAK